MELHKGNSHVNPLQQIKQPHTDTQVYNTCQLSAWQLKSAGEDTSFSQNAYDLESSI